MARRSFLALLLFFCTAWALSEETPPPAIAGYVTAVASATSFDVNGTHIRCNSSTRFGTLAKDAGHFSSTPPDRYLGEPLDIYGTADKKTSTIAATRVVASPSQPRQLSGIAIISQIPAPDAAPPLNPGERIFFADGYRILVTSKTQSTFTPPLKSLAGVETNVWLKYTGKQRPDGVLVADTAVFTQNVVPKREDHLRTQKEYDPTAVRPEDKQSGASKFFLGTNIKKIPPYDDPAMQARVDRIGAALIPAYQRNLPETDATRIRFRFQVIDKKGWHDALTLPNGIILVPRQVVERLPSDAQLATVLTDNIACAIEKQEFRYQPGVRTMTGVQIAADAGSFFVPGLGIATGLASYKVGSVVLRHAQEQSGRVSLVLLHTAGYDLSEAPKAWWLLAPKKPKDLDEIPLPERAAYLYQTLGTTWKSILPAGATAHP